MDRRLVSFAALRRIDLNLLVILDALLTERSVTRAGRRVHLSQPSVSAALARLREIFNDPLLERIGTAYKLTPLALQLVQPLNDTLSSIDRTLRLGETFDAERSSRRFQITTTDDIFELLAAPIMERVASQAPHVRVHFQHLDTRLYKLLDARTIDLAMQPTSLLLRFATTPLFSDTWTVLVCRDNPEVGAQLSQEQLFSLPHASYSLGGDGQSQVEHLLKEHDQRVSVQLTMENIMYLPRLLRGTRLIAIVPSRIAARVLSVTEVREAKLPTALIPTVEIAMGWHPSNTPDPGHRWFRELVGAAASTLEPLIV